MAQILKTGVTESRFYMWRTILAIAHADHIVTVEEINFLSNLFRMDKLSSGQQEMLMRDIEHPQNAEKMFRCITSPADRSDFFEYAQEIAYCDNNFHPLERKLINHLQSISA